MGRVLTLEEDETLLGSATGSAIGTARTTAAPKARMAAKVEECILIGGGGGLGKQRTLKS